MYSIIRKMVFAAAGLCFVMICIAGCGKSKDASDGRLTVNSMDELDSIEDFSGEPDFEYVMETDCQTDLGMFPKRAYTENGYYEMQFEYEYTSMEEYMYLMFYDYATEQTVYVCGKSNCTHDNSSCDAYFDESVYYNGVIWYYEGNVYTEMLDDDYICICKISPDGSTRENVCRVARTVVQEETQQNDDGSSSTGVATYFPYVVLHRGYVYCTTYYTGNTSTEFFRMKLDGTGEKETICTINAFDDNYETEIYGQSPYGRYVFFDMGYNGEDENGTYCLYEGLFAVDTEDTSCIMRVLDFPYSYTVHDNKIYYCKDHDLYIKNLEDGTDELFFIFEYEDNSMYGFMSQLFFDDGYLVYQTWDDMDYTYDAEEDEFYLNNVYQFILNEDGEVLNTVTLMPEYEALAPHSE